MSKVKSEFVTRDEFQASYLVAQAVVELCPVFIMAMQNLAVGYRPGTSA
jgi:hypothetical protein